MDIWVLILTLTYRGGSIATHEFTGFKACEEARQFWLQSNPDYSNAICVPKELK